LAERCNRRKLQFSTPPSACSWIKAVAVGAASAWRSQMAVATLKRAGISQRKVAQVSS